MPDLGPTLVVGNRGARSGFAGRSLDRALQMLASARLRPELIETEPHGAHVGEIADRIAAGDFRQVVCFGGDGTFADAAKAILAASDRGARPLPLGMLPMGTANNQGRSYGIAGGERALATNIATIVRGRVVGLDVGHVEAFDEHDVSVGSDLWFDNVSMGLSATILRRRNYARSVVGAVPVLRSLWRDQVAYLGASAHRYFGTMVAGWSWDAEVTMDGESFVWRGLVDLIVNGTARYAGEWTFEPHSRGDDGWFEVVALVGHGQWLGAVTRCHHRAPVDPDSIASAALDVVIPAPERARQARHIDVRVLSAGRPRLPAQRDGEEWLMATRIRIENDRARLRIIVPAA